MATYSKQHEGKQNKNILLWFWILGGLKKSQSLWFKLFDKSGRDSRMVSAPESEILEFLSEIQVNRSGNRGFDPGPLHIY